MYFVFLWRFVAIWADSAIFNKPFNSEFGIKFFKQGPAYEKEGPDPNKGSNQQSVRI